MKRAFKLEEVMEGKSYSDTYGQYIDCLMNATEIDICPRSWVGILKARGCKIDSIKNIFDEDFSLPTDYDYTNTNLLEMYSSVRPETNDALFKLYNDGELDVKFHMFVNHNTSFFRPYFTNWIKANDRIDGRRKCVISNCSANKPYPDTLHKVIKEHYPDHSLLVVTGVLGVVHEADFNIMPDYDSSMPNQKRIEEEVIRWFKRNDYDEIVILTEFNQQSFMPQLLTLQQNAKIINKFPTEKLYDYYIHEHNVIK